MKFIPNDSLLAVGDRIVTSGHGGLLPPDIPIGHIAEIDGTSASQLISGLGPTRLYQDFRLSFC